MWNETGDSLEMDGSVSNSSISIIPQLQSGTAGVEQVDESSYAIFFTTYDPNSIVYFTNRTACGISVVVLKFCVEGVGLTLTSVLGIIGNLVSIIVLSSHRMRSSTSCFLLCLSICDLIVLLGAMLLVGVPSLMVYSSGNNDNLDHYFGYNEKIAKYGNVMPSAELFALSVTALSGSIFFTMALTLERYFAVCKPFYLYSSGCLCSWTRAGFASAVIVILTVLYCLPRWWEYTYIMEETRHNITIYRPFPTPLRMDPIYDTYYGHVGYVVLQFFLPVGFLTVFNLLIYREIKQANKLRKTMSPTPSQKNENSLTRTLFGVVGVFLLCHLTSAFHASYRYAMGSREYVPEAEFLWCFMLVLNSSVNFIIYCTSGGKFREVFCDMFCFWKQDRRRQLESNSMKALRSWSLSFSSHSRNRADSATHFPSNRVDIAIQSVNSSQKLNQLESNMLYHYYPENPRDAAVDEYEISTKL